MDRDQLLEVVNYILVVFVQSFVKQVHLAGLGKVLLQVDSPSLQLKELVVLVKLVKVDDGKHFFISGPCQCHVSVLGGEESVVHTKAGFVDFLHATLLVDLVKGNDSLRIVCLHILESAGLPPFRF